MDKSIEDMFSSMVKCIETNEITQLHIISMVIDSEWEKVDKEPEMYEKYLTDLQAAYEDNSC